MRRVQRVVDATVWPLLMSGCHTGRDLLSALGAAGFTVTEVDRFRFPDTAFPSPAAEHVLGTAVLTSRGEVCDDRRRGRHRGFSVRGRCGCRGGVGAVARADGYPARRNNLGGNGIRYTDHLRGLTVVPVARAGFGFGGGAGREVRTDGTGEGGGGGGGVDVRPLGYLEIRSGTVRYRPIRDPWRDVAIPLTSLVLATAAPKLLRGIARLRHGRRR